MAICLAAITALLPLILAPHLVCYFDITPKIVVLLVGTAVALLLAEREPRARSPVLRVLGILLVAQTASLAVSTALSKDPALSLGGGTWRRFGLITQVTLLLLVWIAAQYTAGHAKRARLLLRVVAGSGIPVAIYGILQYLGWDPILDQSLYHIGKPPLTIVRPPGTLGYVSYFATYLLVVILAGVALELIEKSRAWKLLGIAAYGLGTVALILTGTRAAMLGLVAGAAFLILWRRPRIPTRMIAAGLIAAATLTVFYLSPLGGMLRNRMRWFIEDPLGGARPLLWRDSIRMAASRWAVGFGPETFSIYFPRYQSPELARAYPDFYQESPHNIFLDALTAQGTPGLAVLVGVTMFGFYGISKVRDRRLAGALGAVLTAVLISQLFSAFSLPTAFFFYLTIALIAGQALEPTTLPKKRRRAAVLACAGVLSLALFGLAAALWYADATLAALDSMIRSGRPMEASSVYQQHMGFEPPGMRTDLWYSRQMQRAVRTAKYPADAVQSWREALAAGIRAARTSDERQNAWLNLAVLYGLQNDSQRAEQTLRSAIEWAPNWFKPHWLLAEVLRATGRMIEARSEAERAADLDRGKDPEVMRTLTQIRAAEQTK